MPSNEFRKSQSKRAKGVSDQELRSTYEYKSNAMLHWHRSILQKVYQRVFSDCKITDGLDREKRQDKLDV